MPSKLIAIGELLIDFVGTKAIGMNQPYLYEKHPGGAPANVAYCVAKLGAPSVMVTKLGQDDFGDYLEAVLKKGGVNVSQIKRSQEGNTSLAFVTVHEDGEREFSFVRKNAADLKLVKKDIDPTLFKKYDFLHFGSVNLISTSSKKAHLHAIKLARKNRVTISFDPNLRFNLWPDQALLKKTVLEFIPLAELIKVSLEELTFLTDDQNEETAVKKLFVGFVRFIAVTKGKDGVTFYTKRGSITVPATQTRAVDTTGAGDAFLGGLLFRLMKKTTLADDAEVYREDLVFANKVAGYVVSRKGAMSAMPSLSDIQ